jgi:hypothetical protein
VRRPTQHDLLHLDSEHADYCIQCLRSELTVYCVQMGSPIPSKDATIFVVEKGDDTNLQGANNFIIIVPLSTASTLIVVTKLYGTTTQYVATYTLMVALSAVSIFSSPFNIDDRSFLSQSCS